MNPQVLKFVVDIFQKTVVPTGLNMLNTRIDSKLDSELLQKEIELDTKHTRVLDKMTGSGLKNQTSSVKHDQVLGLPDFDSLEEFHQAKWEQYFGTLHDLKDNESSNVVKDTMNEILEDINQYPCDSCQENAKAHLENLENKGISFTEVDSKNEAIERLCDFKNEINLMKGNPVFNCQRVIENGYQAKKI